MRYLTAAWGTNGSNWSVRSILQSRLFRIGRMNSITLQRRLGISYFVFRRVEEGCLSGSHIDTVHGFLEGLECIGKYTSRNINNNQIELNYIQRKHPPSTTTTLPYSPFPSRIPSPISRLFGLQPLSIATHQTANNASNSNQAFIHEREISKRPSRDKSIKHILRQLELDSIHIPIISYALDGRRLFFLLLFLD